MAGEPFWGPLEVIIRSQGVSISPHSNPRRFRLVRRLIRPLIAALILLVAAGFVAPMINAARFSGRIREALESSLGRKVTFEKAYFNVFSGPGFSLENVTIAEDPRYGIEPFAYVPVAHARLRIDKLLTGEMRFASLRLEGPSLNLVKSDNGNWNVLDLMQRLSTSRGMPLNLFPALEISDGRIDFKLGLRKTTLYILDTDLSIYPQRSGKLYMRFSGSPARTDRAGMGFGHMRGDVNWYRDAGPDGKQLEADVWLEPSNLSEITTLIEGHDAGVHGTLSSHLQMAGPASDLAVSGDLRLNDVHRWDLMPASGEEWSVHYAGTADLVGHRVDLKTFSPEGKPTPLAVRLRVENFLAQPRASVVAELRDAPLAQLLPLASRLGMTLPKGADLHGLVSGAVGYAKESGWSGGIAIKQAEAVLPGVHALHAGEADLTLSNGNIHLDPATLNSGSGTLKLSGDYSFPNESGTAAFTATAVPIDELKMLSNSWLGGAGPLGAMSDGMVSGQLNYSSQPAGAETAERPAESWSGQLLVTGATISVPGVTLPLQDVRGRLTFRDGGFEFDHLTASLGGQTLRATYHYNPLAKRTERAHVELSRADLSQLEEVLGGSNAGESFWSRLRLGGRPASDLSKRNIEGDLTVDQFFAEGQPLGALNSHFIWQHANLDITKLSLQLPQGRIDAEGNVDLSSAAPRWKFSGVAENYPWAGGSLNAKGEFTSAGAGKDLLRNLIATGSFSGEQLALTSDDTFDSVSGTFQISFANGWPELRVTDVQAIENGDEWTGDALSDSDGKLLINLAHGNQKLHLVSSLAGEAVTASPVSSSESGTALERGLKF